MLTARSCTYAYLYADNFGSSSNREASRHTCLKAMASGSVSLEKTTEESLHGHATGSEANDQGEPKKKRPKPGNDEVNDINMEDASYGKTAYVTLLWGCHVVHVFETLFLGMSLQKTSKRDRICFVAKGEVPLRNVLRAWWEVKEIEHGEPLQWKWDLIHKGYEHVLLLDSNIWVRSSLDSCFDRCAEGGATDTVEEKATKKAEVLVLQPCGAISLKVMEEELFDEAHNFRIQQLDDAVTVNDFDEERLTALLREPEQIAVIKYATDAQPADVILGTLTEESHRELWEQVKGFHYYDVIRSKKTLLGLRAEDVAKNLFKKMTVGSTPLGQNAERCAQVATTLFEEYVQESLWCWPTLFKAVAQTMIKNVKPGSDATKCICDVCANEWERIGCERHVMFECPFVQECFMLSWKLFGPGTDTNLWWWTKDDWVANIHQMSGHPYVPRDRSLLQMWLAYMAVVMGKYEEYYPLTCNYAENMPEDTKIDRFLAYSWESAHHRWGTFHGPTVRYNKEKTKYFNAWVDHHTRTPPGCRIGLHNLVG